MVEIAMQGGLGQSLRHPLWRLITTVIGKIDRARCRPPAKFEAPDLQLASMCACPAMMRFFTPR